MSIIIGIYLASVGLFSYLQAGFREDATDEETFAAIIFIMTLVAVGCISGYWYYGYKSL